MRLRRRPELRVIALVLIATAAVYVAVQGRRAQHPVPTSVTWLGLVGDQHPPVSFGRQMIVVLRTPSVAQRLARVGFATEQQERQWSEADNAAQQQVLVALTAHGLGIRPAYTYSRVLDGFSAALDPRAVGLLEQDPEVAGVYPVRALFPTALRTSRAPGASAALQLPGYDGLGVTVALLDTGIDASQPYLQGRVLPGIDIVGGSTSADAQANPQQPSELEKHGTELAGLVAGAGGPGGIHGVATGANVLPVRVAGWQKDATGREVVYGRSDQLIAGLDRAVDPNGDGDAHDAARIALIGESEPFAAFDDGPEEQAVAGALALDTLVVVPAGNDGPAGPLYGSIGGPGGSPAALTVGATDPRPTTATVRIVLWRGLDVVLDRDLPLLNVPTSGAGLELGIGVPGGSGTRVRDYFDAKGLSLVAGKAALVPARSDPGAAAVAAARAGAKAVLLWGAGLPAGSLGLSNDLGIPVVAVPSDAAQKLVASHTAGVALGHVRQLPNAEAGRIAPFSSRGLAFDGRPKPNLLAPGVGLPTSDPGTASDREPAFATIAGTSAAAAEVAGAAALLAEERPGLGAPQLASLLTGAAGADGAVDVGASAVSELAASATSIAFGTWSGPHWHSRQTVTIENVSSRRLIVDLQSLGTGDTAGLQFLVKPDHFVLRVGQARQVSVTAAATSAPPGADALGALYAKPLGGRPLRIPWAIGFSPPKGSLIHSASLAAAAFKPSITAPTTLTVSVGKVDASHGLEIVAASRLDVLLYRADGTYLGVLARVRDLLPGSYSFGITGHGPGGEGLPPGSYQLRLAAWPTEAGGPSRATVPFRLE